MREAKLRKLLDQFLRFMWETHDAELTDIGGLPPKSVPDERAINRFVEHYYSRIASNTCRKCGGDIDCRVSSLSESCGCETAEQKERRQNMTLEDMAGSITIPREWIERGSPMAAGWAKAVAQADRLVEDELRRILR